MFIGVPARLILLLSIILLTACSEKSPPDESTAGLLSIEALMSPATCADCHPEHYREWSGSMHAYASESPIYRAMNRRGQREVPGGLGTTCVACHAPLAVRLGLTTDGLNMDTIPEYARGVGCYFCHSVERVTKIHIDGPILAQDRTFRGPIVKPIAAGVHKSVYSPLHDRNTLESSSLCGSCHGASWLEWKMSIFSTEKMSGGSMACGRCHMRGKDGLAASTPNAPVRRVHSHMWPGVDVALTPFPEAAAQRQAVQHELDTSLVAQLCVNQHDEQYVAIVRLENSAAGHNWPSCQVRDRRAWVELTAYDANDKVIFSSGNVGDKQPVTSLDDPHLWLLFEGATDAEGVRVLMPWGAVSYENSTLPPPTAISPLDPNYIDVHMLQEYPLPEQPHRITLRVRIRPIGLDVIDDLITSGDLDPAYRAAMPTFELKYTKLEWSEALDKICVGQ